MSLEMDKVGAILAREHVADHAQRHWRQPIAARMHAGNGDESGSGSAFT